MDRTRTVVVVLALALVATPVLAHVPAFPSDNTSPERALVVPDSAKSWSFYDRLASGQTKYYRLSLDEGQRLRVGTFTPSSGGFTPGVVLLSPSLNDTAGVPPGVTVPAGMGAEVVSGSRPDAARYEPFAPSANYHTADVDRTVPEGGTYLVAVYEPRNRTGPVGVTVGYEESFSVVEYLTVPFDLVRVHRWAGQHPLVVLGPLLGTLLVGGTLVRSRRREGWDRPVTRVVLSGAGLLVFGSAVGTLVQTALAVSRTGPTPGVAVTALFVLVPAACGAWTLRFALGTDPDLTPGARATLAVAGVASLATWAGFLVGPALLLGTAAMPARLYDRATSAGRSR